MNGKKWTLYTVILCGFILTTIYLFRFFAQNFMFDIERIIWKTKTNLINSVKNNNYNYIIVGSSKSLALNPIYISKKTNLEGINLSVGGSTILYHYYTIKRLISTNAHLPKLFINLQPYLLDKNAMGNTYLYNQKLCRWFIDDNEAKEVNTYINSFYTDYKTLKDEQFIIYSDRTLLKAAYTDLKYFIKYGDSATNLLKYELINKKGFYLFGKEPVFSDKVDYIYDKFYNANESLSQNGIHESSGIYFNKLIKLLQKNNIDYTFFFSPFYSEQSKYTNLDFGESIHLFNEIDNKKIIKNILLLDGINFVDTQHLNYKGSIIFNDWFIKHLIQSKTTDFNEYTLK